MSTWNDTDPDHLFYFAKLSSIQRQQWDEGLHVTSITIKIPTHFDDAWQEWVVNLNLIIFYSLSSVATRIKKKTEKRVLPTPNWKVGRTG